MLQLLYCRVNLVDSEYLTRILAGNHAGNGRLGNRFTTVFKLLLIDYLYKSSAFKKQVFDYHKGTQKPIQKYSC